MPTLAEQQARLRAIPALDFTCQRCLWNKSNLGRVTLLARPSAKADRLDIPHFSLNNGGSKLNGSGNWRLDGGQSLSSLRIALDTPSLERQLTEWGVDQGLTGHLPRANSPSTGRGPSTVWTNQRCRATTA